MKTQAYSYSDTIAGYVTQVDRAARSFDLQTSNGGEFRAYLTPNTYARIAENLEDSYQDCTGRMAEMLQPGQQVFAYCVFYPQAGELRAEVKSMVFPGEGAGVYRHEEPDWWIRQIRSIANSYLRWQFNYPSQSIDYRNYRTILHLAGGKKGDYLQETDTISRMVYGMASAYMLTGEESFLEAAEKGTEYLRGHMRFRDAEEDLIYWYHGVQVSGDREHKLLTSEFGDDYDSLPMYEQIYALAGPTQTYRLTGDPRILYDIEKTIELFDKFYKDDEKGGYFSHIDPISLDPRSPLLDKGNNRARKNWNSVGDHAPAYLINLWLATGEEKHLDFLVDTADTIVKHFPDYAHSPFVQERFHEDWSHDSTWNWQQDRAVVGHNLKIAWNLMRIHSIRPNDDYVQLAEKIAQLMPDVGSDRLRGGWYDVVERTLAPGEEAHRFVWHDRKAWWQQEQAILAYLILQGCLGDKDYEKHGREAAAFYNAFFLDHDDGGVYFNVLANGLPYLLGNERLKGSHSMSAYHSTELCYLSATYINLLIKKEPMCLYFKPRPDGFPGRVLRVAPDILPKGSVRLTAVEVDGRPYAAFDADALSVQLPDSRQDVRVKVTLTPVK
ncbi:MAG: Cellobiose 2-epimerase [Candidatus Accumulibacter regalis]|uniref:Cellobiose 2-epimerase n=1 Tax=Accumulibacter regalis TaxID=522306 RepID=A0A011QNJ1_ACCRE|nr:MULTISPECIES: AGE family epimerase/isomerase [unclassified Candidatus Accumulibacter]EXI90610.1 MAG: Cellobiose 2-epimerase [Candidatus Accumulibacter regalis]HRE69215.1 AGE family epimerase/isomerase [Accumulibacter sp.]HRE85199.1 AGE family epimerase/isomerase [Accumulibacter sp.]